MANVSCVSLTEGDIFRFTSSLLGMPLVERVHGRNWPFPGLSEVEVLRSSRLLGEVRSTEDGSDFVRRSYLALFLVWLSAPVADVVLEISLSDEFLNLVLEGNAFFCRVVDIPVVSVILVLIPLRAVSLHRIRSFVYTCVLCG